MNIEVLLVSTLGLLAPLMQSNRPTASPTLPLRNTFVVAAETVIDNAGAVDVKADDTIFDHQMQTLKSAKSTLDGMAADDHEHDIVVATNDMVFAISACHIQIKNGANTDCQSQVARARTRAMEAINKHKSNGAWVDGPPS